MSPPRRLSELLPGAAADLCARANGSRMKTAPQHPGDLLATVLEAIQMTQAQLSRRTGLSAKHINQVCQGVAGLSPRSAVLLEEVTGVQAELWLKAQMRHDLAAARTARLDELAADEARRTAARNAAFAVTSAREPSATEGTP